MPTRAEIDPIEIPSLLPYVTLIERGHDGLFRYRLMGTTVSRHLGRDLTGHPVGSCPRPATYAENMRAIYEEIFATGLPFVITAELATAFGSLRASCRLAVPLGIEDKVSMVMSVWTTRSATGPSAAAKWAAGATARVRGAAPANSVAQVEWLCRVWQRDYPTTCL